MAEHSIADGTRTENVLVISNSENNSRIITMNQHIVVSQCPDDSLNNSDIQENGVSNESCDLEEPSAKRIHLDKDEAEESCKMLLMSIHKTLFKRLGTIEKKMESITNRCRAIEDNIENIFLDLQETGVVNTTCTKSKSGAVILGIPPPTENGDSQQSSTHVGTLITLNTEEDFPDGSWLGDPNNPDCRVRCHINPSDLNHVNRTCQTAEKMALTLLDYLFDRETQACSNISGLGKHGKKQLDPLMIYGIRCHLMTKFPVSERDWHRIKQNVDSKCRTAYRRKQKGMPLTVKAFRDRWVPQDANSRLSTAFIQMVADSHMDQDTLTEAEVTLDHDIGLTAASTINIPVSIAGTSPVSISMEDIGEPHIIHTAQGDIQVVHATPEQIAQFQQNGHIQILAGDLPLLQATADSLKDTDSSSP